MTTIPHSPLASTSPHWGPWATLAWSALVIAVFLLAQTGLFAVYVSYAEFNATAADPLSLYDGDLIALATLATTLVCVPLIIGIMKLKRGARLTHYWPLTLPDRRTLGLWLAALAAFVVVSDAISWITGRPIVPDFMQQAYASADSKLLLWMALAVAAPLFEETLFRGFLLTGLAPTSVGPAGAVILTALAWAMVHVQYDWYGVLTIFAVGLLFGAARIKTGSLAVPLLLHALANTIAFVQTGIVVA